MKNIAIPITMGGEQTKISPSIIENAHTVEPMEME
jgi:hypothetical protein